MGSYCSSNSSVCSSCDRSVAVSERQDVCPSVFHRGVECSSALVMRDSPREYRKASNTLFVESKYPLRGIGAPDRAN